MRENRVKTICENGGIVVNGWLHFPSPFSAEIMAHQGFDSLTIDMQHGPVHYDAALPMLQAISTTDTIPLARVPWNEPGIIMKMLDAGCYGIICPMVNNRAECEAFVGACRYPPLGYRSNGPTRARIYAGDDYGERANETVLTFAMIETAEAMQNLDDIMSVPNLDGIYIGPADLSISLRGTMPPDMSAPIVIEAMDEILATAQKHGIIPGLHTGSPEMAMEMFEKGFQFATIQSDGGFLGAHASQVVAQVRQTQTAQAQSGPY
ncbi:2,4-dihydroxyhept-2-ene-1,7-dioic acid aldolase [Chloroflexi bacterium TSY]|nr:2,4-dihydroxyhept-2-ene-1,7-dioic acid aldolase [Chloroflexi bacterium TSY]